MLDFLVIHSSINLYQYVGVVVMIIVFSIKLKENFKGKDETSKDEYVTIKPDQESQDIITK